MCRVLGVHPSGFYRWRMVPVSRAGQRRERISILLKDTYEECEAAYGAPRINQELNELGHKRSLN